MWAAVRWASLWDPARRPGWWLDAPAVLGTTVAALPVVLPVSVVVAIGLGLYSAAEAVASTLVGGAKR
jgi:hypothetical protein